MSVENKPVERMNSFIGKKILAELREGDYAHAGEEEAIELVMAKISKDSNRLILDVGCGLGGTAEYVRKHEWGNVIGIDLDNEAIEYANKQYPECKFMAGSFTELDKLFPAAAFDLVYLFGVFYCLDQELALSKIRKVVKDNAELVICDYIDLSDGKNPIISLTGRVFNPIDRKKLLEMLRNTGWGKFSYVDKTNEYIRWYHNLLNKIQAKKKIVAEHFGEEWYQKTFKTYTDILYALENKLMGGGTYYISSTNR